MTTNNLEVLAQASEKAAATVSAKDWNTEKAADLWSRLISADNRQALEDARRIVSCGRKRNFLTGFLYGEHEFTKEEMRLFLTGCFSAWAVRTLRNVAKEISYEAGKSYGQGLVDAVSDKQNLEKIAKNVGQLTMSGNLDELVRFAENMRKVLSA